MTPAPRDRADAEPDDTPRAVTLAPAVLLLALSVALGGRLMIARRAGAPPALRTLRLDMNSASSAQLRLLPGIGPALAGRIADDRARRGRFGAVDDLARVRGIGPRITRRLAPFATVGAAAGDADAPRVH